MRTSYRSPSSTLYTCQPHDEAGLARRYLKHIAQGFRRLWRDPTGRFRTRRSIIKSVASTNFAIGAIAPSYNNRMRPIVIEVPDRAVLASSLITLLASFAGKQLWLYTACTNYHILALAVI